MIGRRTPYDQPWQGRAQSYGFLSVESDVTPIAPVSPPNPGRWAKLGDAFTTWGAVATAIGTAIAAAWKGWKEWQKARRKRLAGEIRDVLEPLISKLETKVGDQVESLSVESDRRHNENRGDIAPLKLIPAQMESARDDIRELGERVARVEERTTMMYGIIEQRNSSRE